MLGNLGIVILALIAFLPAVAYVVWIRNTEKYNREPWGGIFAVFLWGATIAIAVSIFLEMLFQVPFSRAFPWDATLGVSVLLAPLAEEFAKPLGIRYVGRAISEPEDGLIYGAICGLGFAATENLLYEWDAAASGNVAQFATTVMVRSVASMLLHASATAMTGYGISMAILKRRPLSSALPYYLVAVGMHGAYNFIVSVDIFGALFSLFLAIAFSVACIMYIRKRIVEMDNKSVLREVFWWK
ncbi:MAG: PrsW family intramembrane metalloprotease [Candidatus Thermoplasmatota archaeon]|nr:PrsW family intramembrane metalloprotease [Candidatus Thermoplasmatota archaeon]